jgi:hypothetical protein
VGDSEESGEGAREFLDTILKRPLTGAFSFAPTGLCSISFMLSHWITPRAEIFRRFAAG